MFDSPGLAKHIRESSVIKSQSLVTAEWNMNIATNIIKIGNYRYRPAERFTKPIADQSIYSTIINSYDINDEGSFYTGATDADILIDGGFEDDGIPVSFLSKKEKERMLFSLESTLEKFRPRSGINKLRYFEGNYSHHTNIDMATRPRYYMSHKEDTFKYWSSFRTDGSSERGIANQAVQGFNYIDDAAPFVVYKNSVPANRIVVKMQTNVGTTNLGPFTNSFGSFPDPLFGDANKTTPERWKVQYLDGLSWVDAVTFNETSVRLNGSPIIGPDGYVELAYGLLIPPQYKNTYFFAGSLSSAYGLPDKGQDGQAYLLKNDTDPRGVIKIWFKDSFKEFPANYGWYLNEESTTSSTSFATELVAPEQFFSPLTGKPSYREFAKISGIRIVVDTMNKSDSLFDLIEMSPRLAVDMSDRVLGYSVTKPASDIGVSGLPVGQLLASTGSINIFDFDASFSPVNKKSIISEYINQSIQFKMHEVIEGVEEFDRLGLSTGMYTYHVPIKTLYVDSMPTFNSQTREVSISLRDKFFYFEFLKAPELFIPNASLSYAISTILDSIGFSNYTFKRVAGENEPIIPYFFVEPDMSVAQVLQDLAVSSQSTMFFDEYNNFVVMSKGYILPNSDQRSIDVKLNGSLDQRVTGPYSNMSNTSELANIIEIASQENKVFNDGSIQYKHRYIQRSTGSISPALLIEKDINWIYKPALLWEISPEESLKSVNDNSDSISTYSLTAIPLNSSLSSLLPLVSAGKVINNVVDLGEAIFWLGRYNGYFYANGEIIKYDAVQYSIPGVSLGNDGSNVWISSVREYQQYFSKIPFNGKMYPTGFIRIYSEPNYISTGGVTSLKDGPVARHGRGQFGTSVAAHSAGIDPYWTDNANVRGCKMNVNYLFGSLDNSSETDNQPAGVANNIGSRSFRNGIIKNFFSATYDKETEINRLYSTQTGTVQSSAFVFQGGSFFSVERPLEHISYVYKPLSDKYTHFGTRVRVIGRSENNAKRNQTPFGSMSYFINGDATPENSLAIGGAGGGLGIFVNPTTNSGYYFEIAALSETNVEDLSSIADTFFYKIVSVGGEAIPVKLWSGLSGITVDDGNFSGQYRLTSDKIPTVYDLGVEYIDIGSIRRFFLYLNGSLIRIVDDENPLPIYNNMALFVRGTSRCMFENVYAITANYSQNTATELNLPSASVFSTKEINLNEAFKKYALSGIVQSSYLSGISPAEPPAYNMYFEEFGTIMREAAYLNIRYDKAYPALYAQISPTFNRIKGYTISGFLAGAYGAEFLVFNAADSPISLDETSGNYLRIQGVTLTQEADNELTVDEFFNKTSDFSDPQVSNGSLIFSPDKQENNYYDIKSSRITYGKNEFSLNAPYIQSHDEAFELMSWIVPNIMKPRLSVGVKIFSNPMIQLGDIVTIDYQDKDDVDQVISSDSRFVVYNIEYSRDSSGPSMTIYLSEVV